MICPHCGKDSDEQPTLELTGGDTPKVVIVLPMVNSKFYLMPEHLNQFAKTFPGVNVMRELDKAQTWLIANRSRRPKSNMLEFLRRWLTKAQNSLGGDYGRPRGYEAERAQFERIAGKGESRGD